MGSLVLSYWFWFCLAGLVGLALGWAARQTLTTARMRVLEADVEAFQRAAAQARDRALQGSPAPSATVGGAGDGV